VLTCTTSLGAIEVTINSTGTDADGNNLAVSRSVKDIVELEAAVDAAPVIARVSLDGLNETKSGFLFKDIEFYAASASDLSGSVRNAQGIMNLMNDIKNVAFYGCTFHSTDASSSGFGYKCYTGITTNTGSDFSGLKVIDCTFYDLWNSIISSDRADDQYADIQHK
jgi:hypothetical protein